jgi:hypothetical protein
MSLNKFTLMFRFVFDMKVLIIKSKFGFFIKSEFDIYLFNLIYVSSSLSFIHKS